MATVPHAAKACENTVHTVSPTNYVPKLGPEHANTEVCVRSFIFLCIPWTSVVPPEAPDISDVSACMFVEAA